MLGISYFVRVIDFKEDASVARGTSEESADVTLIMSDENWGALVDGTSSAPKLYLLNKLKLVGSLFKAKKFNVSPMTKLLERKLTVIVRSGKAEGERRLREKRVHFEL